MDSKLSFQRTESIFCDLIYYHHSLTSAGKHHCSICSLLQITFEHLKLEVEVYTCMSAYSVTSFMSVCNPMDYSPTVSSIHGILQAGILECVMMPFSRGSSQPRDQICISCVPCIAGRFFTTERWGEFVRYIHSQMLKGDTYRQITYYRSDLLDIKEDAKESHQKQKVLVWEFFVPQHPNPLPIWVKSSSVSGPNFYYRS